METKKEKTQEPKKTVNDIQPMPPAMKIVVAFAFLVISILLSLIVINKAYEEILLSIKKVDAKASVIKKEITKGKGGTNYYISYSFELKNQKYERKSMFGIFSKKTKIRSTEYNALSEGSSIDIEYSNANPKVNRPKNDPFRNEKMFFILAGAILFGVIAVNEFKNKSK